MSDAKKCDRCGNFYNMDEDIPPERGMINLKNVHFIGAYGRNSTRCGYFDLCPECLNSQLAKYHVMFVEIIVIL